MAAMEYISQRRSANNEPSVRVLWNEVADLHEKRLWYQLSQRLDDLIRNEAFVASAGGYPTLYEKFIKDLEPRMSPYKVAETAVYIATRMFQDTEQIVQFLEAIRKKLKNDVAADCVVLTAIGFAHLAAGNGPAVKNLLEETETKLRNIDDVKLAHPRFYELSSEYYRQKGTYAEYFREALKFLGCADLDKLSFEEKRNKAERLAVAAILGEGVYSFGELLVHPIIHALQTPRDRWLVQSLEAFNYGDQKAFRSLEEQWLKQIPEAVNFQKEMLEKLQLMGIVEMGFKRPPHERDLSFADIAATTNVPVDAVELLLIRALSLKLVKGDIDEKGKIFYMTWVRPRILNMDQILNLNKNLRNWCEDVDSMERLIQIKGREMLAAV